MNAAVSASVVLASRLTTDVGVFALILFSVQAFALFPMLRHRLQVLFRRIPQFLNSVPLTVLQASSTIIQASMTVLLSFLAVVLTAPLSWTVTFIFSVSLLFVTFLAPAMLVWAQKHKKLVLKIYRFYHAFQYFPF
jgi:phosphatidylinositol glycan class C protein